MSTSNRFAVAVHTLALLALADEALPSTAIAGSVNTNPVVIRRILGPLNEAGLIETRLGSEGGALLARRPDQITLLDVYHATESGVLFSLHNKTNPQCICGRNIGPVLSAIYSQIDDAVANILHRTTIATVAQAIVERQQREE